MPTAGSQPVASGAIARRSLLVGPANSRVVVAERQDPGIGEIAIRVLRTGVCASELPVWIDGPPHGEPTTIGHEPVGVVEAIGAGVDGLSIGDVVTGRADHAFSEFLIARADDFVVVPDSIVGDAAIGEPLGCIVEAVRRTPLDVGDRTAIVGLGFMGLCLLQVLATGGVSEIVAIDPRSDARDAAMAHGATHAFDTEAITAGRAAADSFDVVFEVSGSQPGLDLATRLTKEHGTLCIVGYHQNDRLIDMQAWNWKALEVVNGHVRDRRRLTDSTRRGLALVGAGKIGYQELFTHHYGLDDLDNAYADLKAKPPGFVKGVVVLDTGTA